MGTTPPPPVFHFKKLSYFECLLTLLMEQHRFSLDGFLLTILCPKNGTEFLFFKV